MSRVCRFFLHNKGPGQRLDQSNLAFFPPFSILLSSFYHTFVSHDVYDSDGTDRAFSRPGLGICLHFDVQAIYYFSLSFHFITALISLYYCFYSHSLVPSFFHSLCFDISSYKSYSFMHFHFTFFNNFYLFLFLSSRCRSMNLLFFFFDSSSFLLLAYSTVNPAIFFLLSPTSYVHK